MRENLDSSKFTHLGPIGPTLGLVTSKEDCDAFFFQASSLWHNNRPARSASAARSLPVLKDSFPGFLSCQVFLPVLTAASLKIVFDLKLFILSPKSVTIPDSEMFLYFNWYNSFNEHNFKIVAKQTQSDATTIIHEKILTIS